MAAVLFLPICSKTYTMKTISIPAPSATIGKVQTKKAVRSVSRSNLLHFIIEHGFGLFLSASLALCGALLFVFGLFLASGWSVLLGIGAGYLSYLLFTNKDYDEYSIKEALEALATGKEVGK